MERGFPNGIVLACDSQGATKIGPVRNVGGVPVYRYRKQLIRLGNFKTADGHPFQVTPETLSLWHSEFKRMQEAGVPVPVFSAHTKTSGDDSRGHLVDVIRTDEGLDGIIDLVGKDAPRLAASNDVSIYAEPDWSDGEGRSYQWPIRHVALTSDPRIPRLSGFVPLAASNNRTIKVPIARIKKMARRKLALDADPTTMNLPGTGYGESPADEEGGAEHDPLDMILDAIEEESLPKIRAAKEKSERVKLAKEMAHKIDAALAIFEEKLEAGEDEEEASEEDEEEETPEESGETEGEPKEEKPEAHLSNDGSKWCAIEKNLAKRRRASMSNQIFHPELIRLSNENRQMRIEKLFEARRITAHQRKQLLAAFTGEGPIKLSLSNDGVRDSFEQTLTLLSANVQHRAIEMSGAQILADPLKLSNDPDKDPETAAALKLMHEQIGMR